MTLETLADTATLLEKDGVPGLSLAYSTGEEIVTQAWGVASNDTREPVTPDTLFMAGSVTKVPTAYAALRLAAQGRLDLDADVNSLMRSWRVPSVDTWQPAVTVRMLLAHVGGIGDSREFVPSTKEGGTATLPVTFWAPPSTVFSYSGDGYSIVGQVICDITGQSFADAMRELVFEPLGMSSSTYDPGSSMSLRARAAQGHSRGQAAPVERGDFHPAGGLWTTPSDMMRFANAVNSGAVPEMLIGHPVEPSMGHGVFLNSADGIDWWSHGGSVRDRFQCMLVGTVSGPRPFAAMAMTNSGDDSLASLEVLRIVSTAHGPGPIVLRHPVWEDRAMWARGSTVNTEAAGTYALGGGARVILETTPKDWGQNELVLTLSGQPPIELLRVTIGQWRIPGFETYVVYDAPDTIRIVQGSREVRAQRVT